MTLRFKSLGGFPRVKKARVYTHEGDIQPGINRAKAKILRDHEDFIAIGSGWTLKRCVAIDLNITKYQPYRGNSYIPTLKYLARQSVINVKNEDNRCFEWSVLSAMYPAACNTDKTSSYRTHRGKLKFNGIEFPVDVRDIDTFEKQNPTISIGTNGTGVQVDLLLL